MPGILPMKVIKVGSNNQTRIAQACDRCRSKKIRCDGIRPSCTQCVNVGFECKTSDKLSRRAFPRGYTESLEERVRMLESEVRELKELLDEKDEKIDMLSRIHSHAPPVHASPRRSPHPPATAVEAREDSAEKDDTFKVQQSPLLLDDENRDTYCVGSSSGRAFVGMLRPLPLCSFQRLTARRGLQAARPGDGPVVLGRQLQCFLWNRVQAAGTAFAEAHHLVQGATPPGLGPDDQHFLPGVGTAVPRAAPADLPLSVRAVCVQPRGHGRQEVYRQAQPRLRHRCPFQ